MRALSLLQSFLSHFLGVVRLALPVCLFTAALPWLMGWRAVSYFVLGGKGRARKMAQRLEPLMQDRMEQWKEMVWDAIKQRKTQQSHGTESEQRMDQNGVETRATGSRISPVSYFTSSHDGISIHVVTGGIATGTSSPEYVDGVPNGATVSKSPTPPRHPRPLLLFVHGFPECWTAWMKQMAYFAARGYSVAAMDLRGFGLSGLPSSFRASALPDLGNDIVCVVRSLRARGHLLPDQQVVLVGHDWGGAAMWAVDAELNAAKLMDAQSRDGSHIPAHVKSAVSDAEAATLDRTVSKYITLNAPQPAFFHHYVTHVDRSHLFRIAYMLWFCMVGLVELWIVSAPSSFAAFFPYSDGDAIQTMVADARRARSMLAVYRCALFQCVQGSLGLSSGLLAAQPIDRPLLNIWGERDNLLATNLATDLPKQYITHHRSRLILTNSRHWSMNELTDEVNEMMRQFIEEN